MGTWLCPHSLGGVEAGAEPFYSLSLAQENQVQDGDAGLVAGVDPFGVGVRSYRIDAYFTPVIASSCAFWQDRILQFALSRLVCLWSPPGCYQGFQETVQEPQPVGPSSAHVLGHWLVLTQSQALCHQHVQTMLAAFVDLGFCLSSAIGPGTLPGDLLPGNEVRYSSVSSFSYSQAPRLPPVAPS